MSIENLQDLFVHELRDTLDAERQLLKALPKLAKAATNETLQAAFEEHLGVTEGHVNRLKLVKRQMYGRGKLDLLKQRLIAA